MFELVVLAFGPHPARVGVRQRTLYLSQLDAELNSIFARPGVAASSRFAEQHGISLAEVMEHFTQALLILSRDRGRPLAMAAPFLAVVTFRPTLARHLSAGLEPTAAPPAGQRRIPFTPQRGHGQSRDKHAPSD